MPTPSKYKEMKTELLKRRAFLLYQEGMTTREVAHIVGRSHTWVANAVNRLEKIEVDNSEDIS
jgi:transposase